MKALIIYDEAGTIYGLQYEPYVVPNGGIPYIEKNIPEGLSPKSVDVKTKDLKYWDQVGVDTIAKTIESIKDMQKDLEELKAKANEAESMIKLIGESDGTDIKDLKKRVEEVEKKLK